MTRDEHDKVDRLVNAADDLMSMWGNQTIQPSWVMMGDRAAAGFQELFHAVGDVKQILYSWHEEKETTPH